MYQISLLFSSTHSAWWQSSWRNGNTHRRCLDACHHGLTHVNSSGYITVIFLCGDEHQHVSKLSIWSHFPPLVANPSYCTSSVCIAWCLVLAIASVDTMWLLRCVAFKLYLSTSLPYRAIKLVHPSFIVEVDFGQCLLCLYIHLACIYWPLTSGNTSPWETEMCLCKACERPARGRQSGFIHRLALSASPAPLKGQGH